MTRGSPGSALISGLTTPVLPHCRWSSKIKIHWPARVSDSPGQCKLISITGLPVQSENNSNPGIYLQWQITFAVHWSNHGTYLWPGGGAFQINLGIWSGTGIKEISWPPEARKAGPGFYLLQRLKIELKNKNQTAILIWQQYLNQWFYYSCCNPSTRRNRLPVLLANFQKKEYFPPEFTNIWKYTIKPLQLSKKKNSGVAIRHSPLII